MTFAGDCWNGEVLWTFTDAARFGVRPRTCLSRRHARRRSLDGEYGYVDLLGDRTFDTLETARAYNAAP